MGTPDLQRVERARSTASRRARSERERGAAMVEFAMVVPILVALLFGIVDFGMNLSNHISVRQGVREGARQAAVAAPDAIDLTSIEALTKERIGIEDDGGSVRIVVDGTGPPGDRVDAGEPGSEITVCAAVPMRSTSGLYSSILDGRMLTSKVTMRVEQPLDWALDAADPAGGDTVDPTGRSWTWCRADV